MNKGLDKYISELLYDYDCVIIPGLGGIMTNYKPARIENGMAYPPSKEIRFNKNLTKNDGLLAQSISEAEKLSIRDADAFVHECVEKHLEKLNGGDRVELKKVGVLYVDGYDNLRFEPDTSVNYLRNSFGFEVFKLPQVVEKSEPFEEEKAVGERPDKIIPLQVKSHTKGIYRVAAATLAPFIAMSVYLAATTDFKSPTEISLAEIFPSSAAVEKAYSPRTKEVKTIDISPEETIFPENQSVFQYDFIGNDLDSQGVSIDMRKSEKAKTAEENIGIYHIIGGCFSEKSNAEYFVGRLQMRGYDSGILDVNKGLYRVRIESFHDYDKALSELAEMRDNGTFPSAWMLKKKI